MPLFKASYAYDVPRYFDLTVEAATEEEAEAKLEQALKDGVFNYCEGEEFDNGNENTRVFVSEKLKRGEATDDPTLEDLIRAHKKERNQRP